MNSIPQAVYRDQEIARYANNPLIEALPPLMSDQDLVAAMPHIPEYDESIREQPEWIRAHEIETLKEIYLPTPGHIEFAKRFSIILRSGLSRRNPADPAYFSGVPNQRELLGSHLRSNTPIGLRSLEISIVGPSGIGKSICVENTLRQYPQVISHTAYRGTPCPFTQIVWLYVQCSHRGSVKGLVGKIFQQVDNLLGTNYQRLYGHLSTDMMMPHIATITALHGIGCIVIDEIQQIMSAPSGGKEAMVNYFVELQNTVKVPLVLVGTPRAIGVLSSGFASARRASESRSFCWDRFASGDPWWGLFLAELWRYQYTRRKTPLDEDIAKEVYYITQGIPQLATLLYGAAQHAVIGGDEAITVQVLQDTYQGHFRLVHGFLERLRGSPDKDWLDMSDLEWPSFTDLRHATATDSRRSEPADAAENPPAPIPAKESPPPPLRERSILPTPRRKKQENREYASGPLAGLQQAERRGITPHEVLAEMGLIAHLEPKVTERRAA